MQYVNLGRSGLKVSRLCLGTMNFGTHATEEDSFVIMDKALDSGVNFFDTANVYGWKLGEGVTEQIIGRWLSHGGKRDQIVLASKVFGRMGDGPNERRLSAYHIKRACEGSLKRLNTDHIDLYQMHHIDRDTPWDEIWQAMDQLISEGKIIYVGSSNFAGWNIAQAQYEAQKRNLLGLVSEQSLYNLKDRMVELEVIPACKEFGLGLIPYSPIAGGLLAGSLSKAKEGRRSSESIQKGIQKYEKQLEAYETFCRNHDVHPANIALAWLVHNPVVTAPIIGPRTIEQLDSSIKALDLALSDEDMVRLDKLWPGPGGQAPEAYAW